MTTAPPPPLRATRRLGLGAAVVVVLAALAATVLIGMVRTGSAPARTVPATASAAPAGAALYVHVSGAVRAPGLYVLPPASRIVDAVAAAGGFGPGAARDAVNLARTVTDGEQVVVPAAGASPAPAAPASGADGRIDLNAADEQALQALPRIGPALAKRIVDWRTKNGRFTAVDDLLAVSGIGEKLLDGLRDLVRV